MASSEDVLITLNAKDNVSGALTGISSKAGALKTAIGGAMTAAGVSLAAYGKSAVETAVDVESKWNRFGAAVTNNGINWGQQEGSIKSYLSTFSDQMGRSTGDTRDAATALMNYGMSWNDTKSAMSGVAGLAAMTGQSEADASKMVTSALAGRGMAFEKATGLELDNYKTADGSINRAKLFADLTKKTKPFALKFAGSSEADLNRMQAALMGVKVAIGQGLLAVIKPIIPIITSMARAFTSLPGPVKGVASAVVLLATGLMLVAGPIQSVMGLMSMMGVTAGTSGGLIGTLAGMLGVEETALVSNSVAGEANIAAGMQLLDVTAGQTTTRGGLLGAILAETITKAENTIANTANAISIALGGTAAAGATTAFGTMTAAIWGMTTALLANPITGVIIIILALAVAVYEVGKAFGWWNNLGDVLAAVSAGVKRLWSAFMNDPNVKAIVNGMVNAWNSLMQVLNPVIKTVQRVWKEIFPDKKGSFEVVSQIIGFFGQISNIISGVIGAFQKFNAATGILTLAFNVITTPIRAVVSAFQTIICIILGCSPGVIPALQKLGGAFSSALGGVIGFVTSFAGRVVSGFMGIVTGVTQLPSKLWNALMLAIQKFVQFNAKIRATALKIGKDILNGIINNVKTLPTKIWTFLMNTIKKIISFGTQARSRAIHAGLNILNGVVQFVKQLPQNIANFFSNAVGRIIGFAGQALSSAGVVGKSAITGVINYVSQIPQKVYNEFIKIGQKIKDSVSSAVSAATSFGGDIVNAVMGALHIASPGIIQRTISWEFGCVAGNINNHKSSAVSAAKSFGQGIVKGFGSPKLNVGTEFNNTLGNLNTNRTKLNNGATSLPNLNKNVKSTVGANKTIINHFQSGAFSLDARSLTGKECQQYIINGFESTLSKSGTTKKAI